MIQFIDSVNIVMTMCLGPGAAFLGKLQSESLSFKNPAILENRSFRKDFFSGQRARFVGFRWDTTAVNRTTRQRKKWCRP